MDELTEEQKDKLREELAIEAAKLIGIKYEFGASWTDYTKPPDAVDCSELTMGVYLIKGLRCPDGSQAQYNAFLPTATPKLMDLAFFGKNGDPARVYHVGFYFRMGLILEARAHDPKASFETGRVIVRPQAKWEASPNWLGYRSHTKLI